MRRLTRQRGDAPVETTNGAVTAPFVSLPYRMVTA